MLRVTSSKDGKPSGKREEVASGWFFPAPGSDMTRLLEPARIGISDVTWGRVISKLLLYRTR